MYKHVFIIFFFSIIIQSFFHDTAYSDNRLFLNKSVNLTDGKLYLNDILSINGNTEELNRIGNIAIPDEIFSDGYIDRKEIFALLKKISNEIYIIYGNSVRVINPADQYYSEIDNNQVLVKEGDRIKLIVKKNGINIEMQGIVLEDGKYEDEINIKLLNKSGKVQKIVKGRVKSKVSAEAAL